MLSLLPVTVSPGGVSGTNIQCREFDTHKRSDFFLNHAIGFFKLQAPAGATSSFTSNDLTLEPSAEEAAQEQFGIDL